MSRWSPRAGAACIILFVVSGWGALHWQPRTGLLASLTHGCVSVYVWDTTLWNINYRSGATFEWDSWQSWSVDWLGALHLGGPPVARGPGQGQFVASVPLWFPAWAAAMVWWSARRRGWGRDAGRCPDCHYDLRGIAAGAVCPECGRPRNGPREETSPGR